jgi:hypothetical protein
MPNIIINAVKLTGTYHELEDARRYLLQPLFGTRLGLACARAARGASAENPTSDFKDGVFAARWTTLDLDEAILSYTTAWIPSDVVNASVSKVALSYGVQPGDHIAITEVIMNEEPDFWRNGRLDTLKKADSDLFMLTGFFNVSPHYKQIVDAGLERIAKSAA